MRDPRHALDRRGHTPYHVASLRRQALLMEVLHPLCKCVAALPMLPHCRCLRQLTVFTGCELITALDQ